MGTQKVEAWLKCRRIQLRAADHILMMTICHRHRDNKTGSLDIRAERLIEDMPYRGSSRPDRRLRESLRRLSELQIIQVESNGRRYLREKWLHITIVDDEFWSHLEGQQEAKVEPPVQSRLLQSRAKIARPESTREKRSDSRENRASRNSTREERSDSRENRASHSRLKISKEVHHSKDHLKGKPGGLRGVASGRGGNVQGGLANANTPAPRSALIMATAIAAPETAEAVFNTMELPMQRNDKDHEAWLRVVSELEMTLPAATYHTWIHGQTEFVGCRDGKFVIRTSSAFVRDWLLSRAKKKMESALQDITGRTVEIEFLTESQIVEETIGDDSRDTSETLHEVPAGEGAGGISQARAQQRRPSPPLQSVPIGR